jgi:hypothetical protein
VIQSTIGVGTRPQYFCDRVLFPNIQGFTERVHPLRKHPQPVLTASTPWERPGIGALWGPLHVTQSRLVPGEALRLWYQAYGSFPGPGAQRQEIYRCLATSQDGIHFERPSLGLFEFAGDTDNNILAVRSDPGGTGHGMVDSGTRYPDEPPELRYKAVSWLGRDADGRGRHGVAFSPDGLRWTDHDHNPVLSGSHAGDSVTAADLSDRFASLGGSAMPGEPATPARYALLPKVHVPSGRFRRRSISIALSRDDQGAAFTRFADAQLVLAPDQLDDDMAEARLAAAKSLLLVDHPADHRSEFYGMMVFRSGDLFFGLLWVYDASFDLARRGASNEYAIMEVQLVASRDLYHWHRLGERQPLIPRGAGGAFDSHMIFSHSQPIAVGDEWWLYYVGYNEGHAARLAYDDTMRRAYWDEVARGRRHLPSVGLGRARQEGLVSLDAGSTTSDAETRPVRTDGCRLLLNARVADGGEVRVEVQDSDGRPLAPASTCRPITGDGTRLRVEWHSEGVPWHNRDVRLLFHARHAELFSFAFADGPR